MNSTQYQSETPDNTFNLQKIFNKIIRKWYWLLISLVVCIGIAFLANRYTVPVYQMSTTVYVKEPKEKLTLAGLLTETATNKSSNLDIETKVLKSYALVQKTVNDLDLGVSYYQKGAVKTYELYKDSPIKVVIDTSSFFIPYHLPIVCVIENNKQYSLYIEGEKDNPLFQGTTYTFGKQVIVNNFRFVVLLTSMDKQTKPEEITFKINKNSDMVASYLDNLNVWTNGKESTALTLALQGETPAKEIDFLNRHVENFISENVKDKNIVSERTIAFINQLLERNSDSLSRVESRLEQFKVSNSSLDISQKGTQLYGEMKELETQKASLTMANNFFEYALSSLSQKSKEDEIALPAHMGVNDPSLTTAFESMRTLQLENKLLKSENLTKNPIIEINTRKIQEIKSSIIEKIKALQETNNLTLASLNRKLGMYTASQQQLPTAERQYFDIKRNYDISESLVQFLMQKRAEAGITQASNTSDYKIIDVARVDGPPIKPRPAKNYITAIIAGLILPIALIFMADLFNNKIQTREDLQSLTSLPLLGMVVSNTTKKDLIADGLQKTALAESFRTIRSNLGYMLEDSQGKVIIVTSSISGEGKTFCAKNMAYILAISDKKTILVSADMRKTHDHSDLGVNGAAGLSNYLSGMVPLTDVISKTNVPEFFVIKPGSVPPNPAELLLSDRMATLFQELKKHFEYIIMDTPPVGIISDGLELMKQGNLTLYIIRQNYTVKPFIQQLNDIHRQAKQKNMAIIFNDVDIHKSDSKYGLGAYGYGYYQEDKIKKRWFLSAQNSKQKSV